MKVCIRMVMIVVILGSVIECVHAEELGDPLNGDVRAFELEQHMAGNLSAETGIMLMQSQSQRVKNPSVGILLSAVLPGAGEMYAGSWLKGSLMLVAEAALWYGYVSFNHRGDEIEDEFHAYADEHWSRQRWEASYDPSHGATHSLPDTKTQQYYEMIGKYDQFMTGWDDYVEGGPHLTPNRDYYEGLRHDSNIQFRRATTCVMFSMGNRILSVFDTAFTIRKLNRQAEAGLRVGMDRINGEAVPTLSLRIAY